jgi:hypothetical protein
MKYLLAIYMDEASFADVSPEQAQAMTAEYGALTQQLADAGVLLAGEGLQQTATATTVRVRDGERVVSDGPFAETKEQLGGFYMIDVANLDEALGWAEKIPSARTGSIEVRPIVDYEARQEERDAAAAQRA